VAAFVLATLPVMGAPAHAANPSADLDQCENGKPATPKACDWINGNLNENNSHYGEGDSVPYRIVFSNLAVGSTHTVTFEWDTTKSGKHALDYLTSFDRTEPTANPCAGVTNCTLAAAASYPIPDDPNVGPQVAGVFKMWNGAVTAHSSYTLTGVYTGDSSTKITLTFTAGTADPVVLAFGGHIATRLDWGPNNSASGISGSPYHVRLLALDTSGGNQDRSLSAEAVIFKSSITIVKHATPEGDRSFAFTASDGLGTFNLVDDGTVANTKKFSDLTDFYTSTTKATYDFTETVPTGWELSSIRCSTGADVTTDTATATVSVKLAEGTDITCTFNNADVAPTISVTKTPTPATVTEPGGDVSFGVSVTNNGAEPVTLTELDDDVYGDITAVDATTCAVPQTIAAGATYSCSFTGAVTGDAGDRHTNEVEATVTDGEDNDITSGGSADVDIEGRDPAITVTKTPSVDSVVETGAEVSFTVDVDNDTAEPVSLTDLDDTDFGDVTALPTTTCAVPQAIAGNGSYSCTFTALVSGDAPTAHENTVEATASDNEGNVTDGTGTATVAVTDRLAAITVTKTPNPSSMPEPGGDVSFTVVVTNGTTEPVSLYELTDSDFGSLSGDPSISASNCALPATIAGSDTYTCIFTAAVSGDPSAAHANTVTARARDDEANEAVNTGAAEVTFTNVAPAVSVTKTPRTTSVPEPGGDVVFDLVVTNQSVEPVTLYELTDSVFGDVTALPSTTCAVPATLTKPGTYSCWFTAFVAGGGDTTHVNVVTARVRDNEGGTASNTGSASVPVTDVAPVVALAKVADATSVAPGTAVTYTYTATNPGPEPLVEVTVTDDKCSPVVFVGGDTSTDGALDNGESWTYTCTATLTGRTVNTATVVAVDDEGTEARNTATATVEVTDPRLAIDKTASPSSAAPGDTVVYTYVVTNPGDQPLTDVVVSDDKCSPVTFVGGDAADDAVLDQEETWTYTCSVVVGTSLGDLTNIGTVTAKDPSGATVSADDSETIAVVLGVTLERPRTVAGVELPRTGGEIALWALTAGALLAAGFGFVVLGRRRRHAP
jgi:uncharacterized repeat protein (TIGR01451 family)/LPXTG-motif cell wall-anchored protein